MDEKRTKQLGSFVMRVQHCENATWQGTLTWTEKNITQQFRSALELLKLIDSALETQKKTNE